MSFKPADEYLKLIESITQTESTPVIASLNTSLSHDQNRDSFPEKIESAGASAIELSLRTSDLTRLEPRAIEDRIVGIASGINEKTGIPLFLKLSRNLTNLAHLAGELKSHIQGMILFGRSPVVDIELDSLKLSTSWGLTQPGTSVSNLEAIIRFRELFPELPLIACGGIGTSSDLIKAMIAGADAVMVTSALYRSGPSIVGLLRNGLAKFMSDHGIRTVDQLRTLCPPLSSVRSALATKSYQSTVENNLDVKPTNVEPAIEGDRFGHASSSS